MHDAGSRRPTPPTRYEATSTLRTVHGVEVVNPFSPPFSSASLLGSDSSLSTPSQSRSPREWMALFLGLVVLSLCCAKQTNNFGCRRRIGVSWSSSMSPRNPPTASSSLSPSSSFLSTLSEDGMNCVTILGFGSLLSERSSRLTFPYLKNFRVARVHNFRRVFGHPTSIFFQRGLANMETLEMSSLSVEHAKGFSFVASVFEVSKADMMEGSEPGRAFMDREEEFDIVRVPYIDVTNNNSEAEGIICTRSTDEEYLRKWGRDHFDKQYLSYGIDSIWTWKPDSGLRPCAVYLRHCILASKSLGEDCYNSFLDDTYLVDRVTTIRDYLETYPHILDVQPPPELVARYSG